MPAGVKCCVAACSNRANQTLGVTYYTFPKDPGLRRTWLQLAMGEKSGDPDSLYVCSAHFSDEDFVSDSRSGSSKDMNGSRRKVMTLKKNAVPMHNLTPNPLDSYVISPVDTSEFESSLLDLVVDHSDQGLLEDIGFVGPLDPLPLSDGSPSDETIIVYEHSYAKNISPLEKSHKEIDVLVKKQRFYQVELRKKDTLIESYKLENEKLKEALIHLHKQIESKGKVITPKNRVVSAVRQSKDPTQGKAETPVNETVGPSKKAKATEKSRAQSGKTTKNVTTPPRSTRSGRTVKNPYLMEFDVSFKSKVVKEDKQIEKVSESSASNNDGSETEAKKLVKAEDNTKRKKNITIKNEPDTKTENPSTTNSRSTRTTNTNSKKSSPKPPQKEDSKNANESSTNLRSSRRLNTNQTQPKESVAGQQKVSKKQDDLPSTQKSVKQEKSPSKPEPRSSRSKPPVNSESSSKIEDKKPLKKPTPNSESVNQSTRTARSRVPLVTDKVGTRTSQRVPSQPRVFKSTTEIKIESEMRQSKRETKSAPSKPSPTKSQNEKSPSKPIPSSTTEPPKLSPRRKLLPGEIRNMLPVPVAEDILVNKSSTVKQYLSPRQRALGGRGSPYHSKVAVPLQHETRPSSNSGSSDKSSLDVASKRKAIKRTPSSEVEPPYKVVVTNQNNSTSPHSEAVSLFRSLAQSKEASNFEPFDNVVSSLINTEVGNLHVTIKTTHSDTPVVVDKSKKSPQKVMSTPEVNPSSAKVTNRLAIHKSRVSLLRELHAQRKRQLSSIAINHPSKRRKLK